MIMIAMEIKAEHNDNLRRIPLNVRAVGAGGIYQKTTHSTVTF